MSENQTVVYAHVRSEAARPDQSVQELSLVDDDGKPVDIGGGGSVTSDKITDATEVGRSVLKATDAAAARTAIGAGTSNLALGTTKDTALAGDTVIPAAPAAATKDKAGLVKQGAVVADAAGDAPTKAEYDALLKSLRDAGIIATAS